MTELHDASPVDWSTVCIVQCTRDMPSRQNWIGVSYLGRRGASVVQECECSCVATIRNVALTRAIDTQDRAIYLLIDDDIHFGQSEAERIVQLTRDTQVPHSARYVLADGKLAAKRVSGNRWYTGLGFVAIPRALLLAIKLPRLQVKDSVSLFPYCTVGVQNGQWEPEDFSLCRRLGGVVLADVDVAHYKTFGLLPPPRTSPDDD